MFSADRAAKRLRLPVQLNDLIRFFGDEPILVGHEKERPGVVATRNRFLPQPEATARDLYRDPGPANAGSTPAWD